jgi:hypothetical protein
MLDYNIFQSCWEKKPVLVVIFKISDNAEIVFTEGNIRYSNLLLLDRGTVVVPLSKSRAQTDHRVRTCLQLCGICQRRSL